MKGAFLVLIALVLQGCLFNINSSSLGTVSSLSTTSPIATPSSFAAGPKAVKILLNNTAYGSFDALPNSNGTAPGVGLGVQATRVFSPDGTSLQWPSWLVSFELGVSGGSNSAALNSNCATFTSSAESQSNPQCLSSSSTPYNCGAPLGQFRVSEYDCVYGDGTTAASNGNGSGSDGIYMRAVFNRSNNALGTAENILVTIEYIASSVNLAPTNPMNCLDTSGALKPEACADFTWRAYLKHTPSEAPAPFLILVPPISPISTVLGAGLVTKQFVLPIAADPTLTTFQLSRTGSNLSVGQTNLITQCLNSRAAGSGISPLCAGIVFYSITFFRI